MSEATLRVVDGPLVGPVLARVVGMLAARAHCPVDRLDDALLVADAIAAHAPAHAGNGHLLVELEADEQALQIAVRTRQAAALRDDSMLPGVGNVLERIADELRLEDDRLVIRLAF